MMRSMKPRSLILILFAIVLLLLLIRKMTVTYGSLASSYLDNLSNLSYKVTQISASSFQCRWIFDHYEQSPWELAWYQNIEVLQTKVCETLLQPHEYNKSVDSLRLITRWQSTVYHEEPVPTDLDQLFSKMHYRYECTRPSFKVSRVSQYIEPLIGLLRDPLTICTYGTAPSDLQFADGDQSLQSKRFLLLGPSAPYQGFSTGSSTSIGPWLISKDAHIIIVDLGASLFNGGSSSPGPSSFIGARWFYEYLHSKELPIDRIIAFEYKSYAPATYWSQIPPDLVGKLTFVNVGVEQSGKFNPWNVLKTIADEHDYVVVKLDIDTPPLENALIQQVVNDTSISSLIDEMFFEMHINVREMHPYWGRPKGELKDSYALFRQLRRMGIRMHSWP